MHWWQDFSHNYLVSLPIFSPRRPTHKFCFLSCRPFVANTTFTTGLVVSSVSWLGQLAVGVGMGRDDGGRIDNKNKLILTEIFPSEDET